MQGGWLCLWHAVEVYWTLSSQAVGSVDFRPGNVFGSRAAVSKESPPHCHTRPGNSRICFLPTQDGRKGGCDLGEMPSPCAHWTQCSLRRIRRWDVNINCHLRCPRDSLIGGQTPEHELAARPQSMCRLFHGLPGS